MFRRWVTCVTIVVSVAAAGLAGCAAPDKPAAVVYRLSASSDLNPNQQNQPSPVVLRFFELNSSGRFESAEFFALFNEEKTTLGPTMLDRNEVQVWPSEKKEIARELQPSTRMVGIVAAFRDLDLGKWRAVVMVKKGQTKFVDIQLKRSKLSAKIAKN